MTEENEITDTILTDAYLADLTTKVAAISKLPWFKCNTNEIWNGKTFVARVISNVTDLDMIVDAVNALPLLFNQIASLKLQRDHAERESDILGSACDKFRINSRIELAETLKRFNGTFEQLHQIGLDHVASVNAQEAKKTAAAKAAQDKVLIWSTIHNAFVSQNGGAYSAHLIEATIYDRAVAENLVADLGSHLKVLPLELSTPADGTVLAYMIAQARAAGETEILPA